MVEKVIVIILIAAAVSGWIYAIYKQTKQPPCDGCSGCALRDKCTKITDKR